MLKHIIEDLTKLEVDAIVNAANCGLSGGGGVDGAIHRAAGSELMQACRALGGCETGKAKITLGFRLPAKYVIHTVGPVWYGGHKGEADLLASCYREALRLADQYELKTIAFPSISTGAYGFPLRQAAELALTEIRRYLAGDTQIESVTCVCFDKKTFKAYQSARVKLEVS
ncbi:MAG: O-acetyl-ADP-ribose deacetylase [Candidatus Promineifilaceae bacterium]